MVTCTQILGSSSKDISERRKSTGSRRFEVLGNDFSKIFQQFVSIRVRILRKTNLAASRHTKTEKTSLPVDVSCFALAQPVIDLIVSFLSHLTSFNRTKSDTDTQPSSAKTHKMRLVCFELQRRAQLCDGQCTLLIKKNGQKKNQAQKSDAKSNRVRNRLTTGVIMSEMVVGSQKDQRQNTLSIRSQLNLWSFKSLCLRSLAYVDLS